MTDLSFLNYTRLEDDLSDELHPEGQCNDGCPRCDPDVDYNRGYDDFMAGRAPVRDSRLYMSGYCDAERTGRDE